MYRLLFLFVLISTLLVADAQTPAKPPPGRAIVVRGNPIKLLKLMLAKSNIQEILPAGAKIDKIKSVKEIIVARDFKINADVSVNGAVKPYCIEASRIKKDFKVEKAQPGACA